MYYIYTTDLVMLDTASQYADAFYKAHLFADLRGEIVSIYYNTNYKHTVNPK